MPRRSARALCAVALLAALTALVAGSAQAGAFLSAGESSPDRITHPPGYTGSGGTLTVDVCIDSTSANASDMIVPVQNAIATYNALDVHRENLVFGKGNVPGGAIDFESIVLHELGHCLGLAHSNLASESGVDVADQDYTKSADGSPNSFDLATGADGLRATGDDGRGDDVNFYWYEDGENDPFRINASVVDSTTFSRGLSNLPAGDAFAASGDRANASSFSVSNGEAVMNQGTFSGEEQRLLTADDVSALRYAASGRDESAGNGDDYTLVLSYAGSSPNPSCDINIDFDDGQTSFAVCAAATSRIGNPSSTHYRISSADIYLNTGFSWFFNQETCGNGVQELSEECDDGNLDIADGCSQTCTVETNWTCTGFPSVCTPICGDEIIKPPFETCDDGNSESGDGCDATCQIETGWSCLWAPPSVCSEDCGTCDDGGTSGGDGCDASCQLESGWMCGGMPSVCGETCGDGVITLSETCDDGGTSGGDGCDASCQLEDGWVCSGMPSLCDGDCGDGTIVGSETCDDGGTSPGDGCDAVCQVESGWSCQGEPSACTAPTVDFMDTPARVLLALGLLGLGGSMLAARRVRARSAV